MEPRYEKLYGAKGLAELDASFISYLGEHDAGLKNAYLRARDLKPEREDELTLKIAPLVEDFIAKLFNVTATVAKIYADHGDHAVIAMARRQFVQRYAVKNYREVDGAWSQAYDFKNDLDFAKDCLRALNETAPTLEAMAKYAAWATLSAAGKKIHENTALFTVPLPIDPDFAVRGVKKVEGVYVGEVRRERDGFALTDPGMSDAQAAVESGYCLVCHPLVKDSCRTGIKNTSKNGCPLDENISVMHALKREGANIAALAAIMVDNPMVAATGHRICNDCMIACIFQKQDPVNTPAVETNILRSVLEYPYGFEIYSLLTRWNPLNFARVLPKADSGYKVLTVGLGPSGFSMAYYLARDGHFTLGIDGSKLEPLPESLLKETLIKDIRELYEPLDDRILWGFGGVAEYGITVRWNKNFLKIIRLVLTRNANIKLLGSIRFGGQITPENAQTLGFDEVVTCTGSGTPKMADIEGSQLAGVRFSGDFLMNLQLTGAYRKDLLINLQLLTPIIVIGGGLSAIDAATEAKVYYERQREKFFELYDRLVEIYGEEAVRRHWSARDAGAFEVLLNNPKAEARILYRQDITKAPAYRQNPNELRQALSEGVIFEDNTVPSRFTGDALGQVTGVWARKNDGVEEFIPARSVILALGNERAELKSAFTYGDANPEYAGSVVKAIAAAKYGHPDVTRKLYERPPLREEIDFDDFEATVIETVKSGNNSIAITIRAPLAARAFKAGQFYKLQNFEATARAIDGVKMVMEPIALTPTGVDEIKGTLTFMVVNSGSSSAMVAYLKKGEKVSLTGPMGAPVEPVSGKTVLLIGGGQFNLGIPRVAEELRRTHNRVWWLAAYRDFPEIFDESLAKFSENFWICAQNDNREGAIRGNAVDGLRKLAEEKYLNRVEKILIYGTTPMQKALKKVLAELNFTGDVACNLNLPMQCMMGGVCGQCSHVSETGEKTFCCKEQDLDLRTVNFDSVENRSQNNSLVEKISKTWLRHVQANEVGQS